MMWCGTVQEAAADVSSLATVDRSGGALMALRILNVSVAFFPHLLLRHSMIAADVRIVSAAAVQNCAVSMM